MIAEYIFVIIIIIIINVNSSRSRGFVAALILVNVATVGVRNWEADFVCYKTEPGDRSMGNLLKVYH